MTDFHIQRNDILAVTVKALSAYLNKTRQPVTEISIRRFLTDIPPEIMKVPVLKPGDHSCCCEKKFHPDFTEELFHCIRLYEQSIHDKKRHSAGIYFTPRRVAARIAKKLTDMLDDTPRIIDPACGCGSILIELYTALSLRGKKNPETMLYGVDLFPENTDLCRLFLFLLSDLKADTKVLAKQIICADALADSCNSLYAVKWETSFSEVFSGSNPGFDAVCGNPPWVSLKGRFKKEYPYMNDIRKELIKDHYRPNLFSAFLGLSDEITAADGITAFVMPGTFCSNFYYSSDFERMKQNHAVSWEPCDGFNDANTDTGFFIARKDAKHTENTDENEIFSTVSLVLLSEYLHSSVGFIAVKGAVTEEKHENSIPVLKGRDIGKFRVKKNHYMEFVRENLCGGTQNTDKLAVSEKICVRKTGDTIIAAFDDSGAYCEQSLYFLYGKSRIELFYVMGLLNSSLYQRIYFSRIGKFRKVFAHIRKTELDQFPVMIPDFDDVRFKTIAEISEKAWNGGYAAKDACAEIDRCILLLTENNYNKESI